MVIKKKMKIEVKKFGDVLISRPAGREAYLALKAYTLRDVPISEPIEIDFAGVKVLAPSWADEFVTKVAGEYPHTTLTNTDNLSVKATLETLRKYSDMRV